MKDAELKQYIFESICHSSISIIPPHCISIRRISAHLCKASYSKCLRIKDELLTAGLIKKETYGGGICDWTCEPSPPYHGYAISEKGKLTDTYRNMKKDHDKELNDAFFSEFEESED